MRMLAGFGSRSMETPRNSSAFILNVKHGIDAIPAVPLGASNIHMFRSVGSLLSSLYKLH